MKQPTTPFPIDQVSSKEFYYYTFPELCSEVGQSRAQQITRNYLKSSKEHAGCKGYVLHNCPLLSTYTNQSELPVDTLKQGSLLDSLCSVYYNPVTNKVNKKDLSIRQIADLIRSDTFAPQTETLRGIREKNENRGYKQTAFCYATFSGTYAPRCKDDNLVQHSGFICLDMDHLNERLKEVKAIVNGDPSTVMSFTSPNGDGLKVLYEMDPNGSYNQEQYYRAYSAHLSNICGLPQGKIDTSCKNVSRACFLPWDPTLFINPYFVAQ